MGAIELLILLLLFLLLIGGGIAVVVFAVSQASRRTSRAAGESAVEILRRRYARGEITREEYQAMRQDLDM